MNPLPQEQQLPPHDIDLEQSILAGCILWDESREAAIEIINELDFYKTAHQKIFKAIKVLSDQNKPIGLVEVCRFIKDKKAMELVGGAAYIAKITDTAPIPDSTKDFCEKLRGLSRLRQIIRTCQTFQQKCFDCSTDSIEAINQFQAEALRLDDHIKPTFITKEELTTQTIDRYQKIKNGKTENSIPTGYHLLDRYLGGGFKGSKLVILAARPGVGKTALMCNMVRNMCSIGVFCGVFSLEMEKEELDDRWMSADSDVNSMVLTTPPGPSDQDWQRIMRTAGQQADWSLLIDDNGGIDIQEIKRRARKMKKAGAEIIFIDQLSKISGNRKLSIFERNTEHVEEFGFLKKELGIPIVLLAQLNRDLEKRFNKKPVLSDLKNTGQLEEEADIVLLGYRKFIHSRKEEDRHHAEWEIAKNRQGATRNIDFYFNDKRMRFDEIEHRYYAEGGRYAEQM